MSGLLFTGITALLTYQRALDTTGHNIANANNPGYSRQRTDFVTLPPSLMEGHYVGNGVRAARIERVYDDLLAGQVRINQSVVSQLDTYFTQTRQIDDFLANPDSGLQPAISSLFDSFQELANDPASLANRQVALSEAQALADRFKIIDDRLNQSRTDINQQMMIQVDEINRIATNLAELNEQIVAASGATTSGIPNDMLDERDRLLTELSSLVDIRMNVQSDGAINVFIGNGQTLVIGNQASTLGVQPSTTDASKFEITLESSFGSQPITSQLTGGEIGGLIKYRDEVLYPAQNQLGLIALGMAQALNQQHALGVDLDGLAGTALFGMGTVQVLQPDSTTGVVNVDFDNIRDLTGSDYRLDFDGTNYSLTRLSDGTTTALSAGVNVIDGMSIDIDPALSSAGDTYLIQPTRNAAASFDLLIDDPRRLAASSPVIAGPALDVSGSPLNTGDANLSKLSIANTTGLPLGGDIQLVYDEVAGGFQVYYPGNDPATLAPDDFIAYDVTDPATVAGTNVPGSVFTAYGEISFQLSGIPADGDTFVISDNTTGEGDNANALALGDLEMFDYFNNGGISFSESYSQLVADIGVQTRQAEVSLYAHQAVLERSQDELAAVSGVNLDEEAGRLIQYQQAYQAAAQMITVANTVFNTLLSATSR